MELARKHGIRSFPTIKYFPKELKDDEVRRERVHPPVGCFLTIATYPQASSKLDTKKANNGGELYHGALTVESISKFIETANFLERFKPPPPPPPAPWHSWLTGGGSQNDDEDEEDSGGTSVSTGTMDWGNGFMTETSTETISYGPNGEMMIEESFTFRL